MTSTSKVILGIVGAAAAGVVIGLLLAPDKGTETRRKIGKTAGQWANELSNLFDHGKAAVEDMANKVKGVKATAEEKAARAKESFS
jgi:gas vesicle protein